MSFTCQRAKRPGRRGNSSNGSYPPFCAPIAISLEADQLRIGLGEQQLYPLPVLRQGLELEVVIVIAHPDSLRGLPLQTG